MTWVWDQTWRLETSGDRLGNYCVLCPHIVDQYRASTYRYQSYWLKTFELNLNNQLRYKPEIEKNVTEYTFVGGGVKWHRQLFATVSLWRPRFDPRPCCMGFVVDKVTPRQVYL